MRQGWAEWTLALRSIVALLPGKVFVIRGRDESQQIADGASAAVKHQLLWDKGKALLAPAPAV